MLLDSGCMQVSPYVCETVNTALHERQYENEQEAKGELGMKSCGRVEFGPLLIQCPVYQAALRLKLISPLCQITLDEKR